jgi:hypothetical protein
MKHPEYELHKNICKYLKLQYPTVFYHSDTIANLQLTMNQKIRNKAIQCENFACPDLLILHPNNRFNALFIEIKVNTPYNKNGTLKKQMVAKKNGTKYDHLQRQNDTINQLNKLGYYATFGVGFDDCIRIIDSYMKNEISNRNVIFAKL